MPHLEIDKLVCALQFEAATIIGNVPLPPSEERIAEFERSIGFTLPDDYRYFLSRHAGTRVNPVLFEFAAENKKLARHGPSPTLLDFHGFHVRTKLVRPGNDLYQQREWIRKFLPPGVISIAESSSEYWICISCRVADRGTIFIKTPEDFANDDPADFLFRQADSFTSFLRSLKRLTEDEESAWWDEH